MSVLGSPQRGIAVEVIFPRWILRVAGILLGLSLILMIVGAIAFSRGGSDSSSSFGYGVLNATREGEVLRVTVQLQGSGELVPGSLEGWSVLLQTGEVVPAAAVNPPPPPLDWESGFEVTVEAAVPVNAVPLRLRFDPDGELGPSLPLPASAR